MLYWKNDVDLEYCKFCGNARYKLTQRQDSRRKKSLYAILRFLSLTPDLQRRGSILTGCIPILQKSRVMFGWAFAQMILHRTVSSVDVDCERPPAYEMASGWSTTGVMGCQVCMDDTRALHLQHGRKVCYFDCHRQFLPEHHPYRRNKKAFTKNRVENKVACSRLNGDQLLDWVADISPAVEMSLSLPSNYGSDHKWTKKIIFWDLPYWSTLLIRHNLDVMHIEKNILTIYSTRSWTSRERQRII
ncbi:UNVERIFIED_CONTAM: hypothetical protein Slati_2882100 [Sesamum latifolium]|uniref:Uncharacterized protein n=1 Tax=Sesamum latifolium TaxID=2727402 RepID=A0AAW2VCZ5_9LAMI